VKNKLLFFNKEGYPYNFEYDKETNEYNGSIMFDENSNDTFKTIGMYIFEEVPTISFKEKLHLNKMELYNTSGITFQGSNYLDEKIDDIKKVNSDPDFSSKWIFGKRFDEKFKKGSLITFNDLLFENIETDFSYNYYTVLENKPNAIMINTNTKNDIWSNVFSGGTISSVNYVSYNDYDGTLINTINNYTLHEDKKLSISGTKDINDGINSFKEFDKVRTFYQNYEMSGGTGETFKVELELFTERPKLYQGEIDFIFSGSTAILNFKKGFNSKFNITLGEKIIFEDYFDEPILPTNPIFTIRDGVEQITLYDDDVVFNKVINDSKTIVDSFNSKKLTSKRIISNNSTFFKKNLPFFEKYLPKTFFHYDNYIKINGTSSDWLSDINIGDHIKLETTNQNSSQKNINRTFSIKKIKTFEDIIIEKYKNDIHTDKNWHNSIKEKARLKRNTLHTQVKKDAKWMYEKNENNKLSKNYVKAKDRYEYIYFNEYINLEDSINRYKIIKKLSVSDIKTIVCDFSPYTTTDLSFTKKVIGYDTTNIVDFEVPILKKKDTQDVDYIETINSMNNKFKAEFDKYGLLLYYTEDDNKVHIHSIYHTNQDNYLDTKLFIDNDSAITNTSSIPNSYIETAILEMKTKFNDFSILPYETEKFDNKYHVEIMLDIQNNENNYGLMIEVNDVEYYTAFDTDNETTISNFLSQYTDIFNNNGLLLASGLTTEPTYVDNYKQIRINYWTKRILNSTNWYNTIKIKAIDNERTIDEQLYLDAQWMYNHYDPTEEIEYPAGQSMITIDGLYPNIDVRTLKVKVNIYSEYEIMNEQENRALFITGNEIELTNISAPNFFDYGLSTGMILSISGSSFNQNNKSYNIIGLTENVIELSYQGTFFDDYTLLEIDTQTFLRKPRESYDKDIYYSFKFTEPKNNEPFTSDIFFYDISGEHLTPVVNTITGEYIEETRYIGPKPLWTIENECDDNRIALIDEPNSNLNEVSNPLKQQTVFRGKEGEYCLNYLLDEFDSRSEFNFSTEPLQVFLGFNSPDEGVEIANIVMDLVDKTYFSGYTYSEDHAESDYEFIFDETGLLTLKTDTIFDFQEFGFEAGQDISIDFIDETKTGTTLFYNYGKMRIEYVSGKIIKIVNDTNLNNFSTMDSSDSFHFKIKVLPKTILRFDVVGETEIEDERFEINLKNLGMELNYDVEHIFADSDIKEDGIDYKLLNKKRKEMLAMYPEIYNYIGSYKALINAINFFGWNDLKLNEYYRNLKPGSELYKKLIKVEIQDIFDNTVDAWTDNDYIKGTYDNKFYKKTNLFNLTYNITDEDGRNILMYSLEEMQIKLTKLKRWLKKNIIPLSANLVDITGVAQTSGIAYHQFDVSNFIKKSYSTNEVTAVNFNITETLSVAQNYLFQIDFYTSNDFVPSGWTCKIKTFSKNSDGELINQQDIDLMKNDLKSFSFNIDKNIDKYIYIETKTLNDYGFGHVYNKFLNTSTSRNYQLLNNNFKIPGDVSYLPIDNEYYWFDEQGSIWLKD